MAKSTKSNSDDDLVNMSFAGSLDDEDFDEDFLPDFELESIAIDQKSTTQKQKKGVRKKRVISRPDTWDDDWVDPEDDLMYGFDHENHRRRKH